MFTRLVIQSYNMAWCSGETVDIYKLGKYGDFGGSIRCGAAGPVVVSIPILICTTIASPIERPTTTPQAISKMSEVLEYTVTATLHAGEEVDGSNGRTFGSVINPTKKNHKS